MMPTQQQKRGLAAALAAVNPTPLAGEIVWVSDTNTLVVGNGSSAYSSLSVISATPTSHTHGNISNAGAIGSTADQFVVTTTSGVLTAVSAATARTTLSVQPTASPAFTGTTTVENLTLSGSARRIVADFSTTTLADRAMFQTSASNGPTVVTVVPSGTGTVSQVRCASNSTITNAHAVSIRCDGTEASLRSEFLGTASASNLALYTNNAKQVDISSTGTATFAGQIVGQAGAVLTGTVAGNVRQLRMQTSGSTRWEVGPGFDAESGSNVGSTFWITRWSDAGAFLGTPISIARATGNVTFESQVLVTAGSGSSGSYKPGLAVSGDDDSGVMQVGGANTLSLVTAGNERLRVTDSRVFINGNGEQYGLGVRYVSTGGAVHFGATSNSATPDAAISNAGGGTLMTFANDGKITAAGVYNNTVGGTNRDVFVDSGGLIGYVSSIRESKTDIVTLDDVSWLSALSPVSYRYRKKNADGTYSDEADGVTDYGLIAEDVEAVKPELCFYDDVDGEPQLRGVTYSKLITPMLRYIQQLEARIAALEERLNHG